MSDLSDETVRALAASVFDLEDDREQVQTDLKNVWSHIREAHGKRFADSLKLAIKRARMDQGKRIAADEVDAEAERLIGILNGPRAPRATRSASAVPIPPHDEDGVVLEDGGEQLESHAQQGVEGGDQASIIASEATMLPQTVTATMPVASTSELVPVESSVSLSEPVTIPPVLPTVVTEAGDQSAVLPPPAALVVASNSNAKKLWTFNDPAHRDCLDPGMCGGFSNLKVCQKCREAAAAGQVA